MQKYIKKTLTTTPPKGCNLKVGDLVDWTNDYGVKWQHRVIGFNTTNEYNAKYKKYVHIDTDSYWFPHAESDFKKVNENKGMK